MSASKINWNKRNANVPLEMKDAIKRLNKQHGNSNAVADSYVKWAVPASLYYFLEDEGIEYIFFILDIMMVLQKRLVLDLSCFQ